MDKDKINSCNSCKRLKKNSSQLKIEELIYMIHKGYENNIFEFFDDESKSYLEETIELPFPDLIMFHILCTNCKDKYFVGIDWYHGRYETKNLSE